MGNSSSQDLLFDLLSNRYRRQILRLLSEADSGDNHEVTPADLATETDDVEAVTLRLLHNHLPKLAEAGYVEWDWADVVARRGPRFEEVEPLISLLDDLEDPPSDRA